MEMQPPNLFVRQCELYGDTFTLDHPFRCFHYFRAANKRELALIARAGKPLSLVDSLWVTPWAYYTATQARLALALPGSAPDTRLSLFLPGGTRLRGPAWVAPLARAAALAEPDLGRPGNGIEYQLVDPVVVTEYSLDPLT